MNDNKCYICGVELTKENTTADHVFPKSLGGKEKRKCCLQCNRTKRDLLPTSAVLALVKFSSLHMQSAEWVRVITPNQAGAQLCYPNGEVIVDCNGEVEVVGIKPVIAHPIRKVKSYIEEFRQFDYGGVPDKACALLTALGITISEESVKIAAKLLSLQGGDHNWN